MNDGLVWKITEQTEPSIHRLRLFRQNSRLRRCGRRDIFSSSAFCVQEPFYVCRRHDQFPNFVERYQEYYNTGEGLRLRRFYDGEVYGAVVEEFERRGAKMLELNPGYRHKTPIPRSIMAPYIMHYKAGAKEPFNSEQLLAKHNIHNEDSSLSQISSD